MSRLTQAVTRKDTGALISNPRTIASSNRTELTTDSPLWVGAWWIGFLGAGIAAFLIAIPILGYPRQLPGGFPALAQSSYPGGRSTLSCPVPFSLSFQWRRGVKALISVLYYVESKTDQAACYPLPCLYPK